MRCEMCGRNTETYVKAIVEGSTLNVCDKCGSHGTILKKVAPQPKIKPKEVEPVMQKREVIEEIVPNYSEIIRNVREKLGFNHEKFAAKISEKVSLLHKIETGHYTPNLKLANKLEKMFNIELIQNVVDIESPTKSSNESTGFTLGDLIKKKLK